ncbi:hypothetical protein ACOTCG_15090 [Achromobacter xylosoxidans]
MKQIQSRHLLFAILACAASAAASAQSSTATPTAAATPSTLNVAVGGVISPGSCTPASSAIAFDLNKINPTSLKDKAETPLAPIVQDLSIKCDGDTSVALSVAGTAKAAAPSDAAFDHKATGIQAEAKKGYIYDLVDVATTTKRIGRYVFQFRNFTYTTSADNAKALKATVVTSSDRASWTSVAETTANAAQLKSDGSTFVSFANPATPAVPVSAKEFDGSIVIGAAIVPKSELTINDELKFRGETTITLSYL